MADPHHVEALDGHDRLTVVLYRTGIVVAAAGVLLAAVGQLVAVPVAIGWALVAVGTAMCGANLHLYDKRVRWVIAGAAVLGLLLQAIAPTVSDPLARWVFHAGVGFQFVALSGIALKERFCFRIPGLRAVPLLLAVSLVPLLGEWRAPAAVLLGVAGALLGVLSVAKWRMPLHFDIGDRSRYQV